MSIEQTWESKDKTGKTRKGEVLCSSDGIYSIRLYESGALVKDLTMSNHNKAKFYANEEAENWCLNKKYTN